MTEATTVASGFAFLEARAGTRAGSGSPTSTPTRSCRRPRTARTSVGRRPAAAVGPRLAARRPAAGRLDARPPDAAPRAGRQLVTHADLSALATGHFNDMVVDAEGRAYVGNFGFDLMGGGSPRPRRCSGSTPTARCTWRRRPAVPERLVISPTATGGDRDPGQPLPAFDLGADGALGTAATGPASPPPPRRSTSPLRSAELKVAPDGTCARRRRRVWAADAVGPARAADRRRRPRSWTNFVRRSPIFACALGRRPRPHPLSLRRAGLPGRRPQGGPRSPPARLPGGSPRRRNAACVSLPLAVSPAADCRDGMTAVA